MGPRGRSRPSLAGCALLTSQPAGPDVVFGEAMTLRMAYYSCESSCLDFPNPVITEWWHMGSQLKEWHGDETTWELLKWGTVNHGKAILSHRSMFQSLKNIPATEIWPETKRLQLVGPIYNLGQVKDALEKSRYFFSLSGPRIQKVCASVKTHLERLQTCRTAITQLSVSSFCLQIYCCM